MQQKYVNCLNKERLDQTMESIKQTPNQAQFKFRCNGQWIEGVHAYSVIQNFEHAGKEAADRPKPFVVDSDEPKTLLGANYAPNPTEWALHALTHCVGTTLMYHATARGVNIDNLAFDLEGDLDIQGLLGLNPEVRPGYQKINMNCRISGDASAEQLRELAEIGTSHSPVFDMISASVPIEVRVQAEPMKKAA